MDASMRASSVRVRREHPSIMRALARLSPTPSSAPPELRDYVHSFRYRTYDALELGNPATVAEEWTVKLITTLIILSVVVVVVATVPARPLWWQRLVVTTELLCSIIFSIELALRFWSCTVDDTLCSSFEAQRNLRRPWRMRARFALRVMTMVDLLAIFPFYFTMVNKLLPEHADLGSGLTVTVVFRLCRLLRLFKLYRYTSSVNLLTDAFSRKKEQLIMSFFLNLLMLVMSSSVIYFFEHRVQPAVFSSIPTALWWGVATLTTVGYGDMYPITSMGKLFGSISAILGVALFALPAGIISSAFIELSVERKDSATATLERARRAILKMRNKQLYAAFHHWKLVFPTERSEEHHDDAGPSALVMREYLLDIQARLQSQEEMLGKLQAAVSALASASSPRA
eukprot:PLAT15656.1.p1 GENE.PLAT15656.1~~PLAT15656.1.p1  ORF type:complete len:453 (-),score=230.99 PLAT15656.1:137-1333(-)